MIERLITKLRLDRYLSLKIVFGIDLVVSLLSSLTAILLFETLIFHQSRFAGLLLSWAGLSVLASSLAFLLFRTYRSVIRYSSLREIWKIMGAVLCKEVLLVLFMLLATRNCEAGYPLPAMFVFDALVTLCAMVSIRGLMILLYDYVRLKSKRRQKCMRVLIFDTGDQQVALITRLKDSPQYNIRGFMTYGKQLKSHILAGLSVYYFEEKRNVEYVIGTFDIDAVLFASDESARSEQDRLIKYCLELGVKILIAPSVGEIVDGKVIRQSVREIKIEDLLGRPEIEISMDEIRANFRGKTVLVTGAAGSIGSEICRQLAGTGVARLVLFDNAETPMHNIRLELEDRFPSLKFIPVIGDVRMEPRLDFAFRTYRPQIVFHAAAYKHVPLMEENPCEAVLVNVVGTRKVADACLKYGVGQMVMISTDKAVNPTNVMGASKRLAEIYVQSLGQAIAAGKVEGRTKYVTTRFGNVLGSNGSVIPRFREQIAKGGPVMVTHPDIVRFFMTIPEACRLVMEAAVLTRGNEIFVFDMGEPVRIADLAKRMIGLAGFEVDKDIRIVYTGLRPGEKLYEEVLSDKENTRPTSHEKIRIARVREYDVKEAWHFTDDLERLSVEVNIPDTVRLMKRIVPEFKSNNSVYEQYDKEIGG